MSVATSASPISSVPDPSASPITSVPEHGQPAAGQGLPAYATYPPSIVNRLHLDLRGTRLTVDRETLMTLPESVLLCLFPNGLVLSPLGGAGGGAGHGNGGPDGEDSNEDNEVYIVDVSPQSQLGADLMQNCATDSPFTRSVRPRFLSLRARLLAVGTRPFLRCVG